MKRQIRQGVFETNSSSTHSITMCSGKVYDAWKAGELYFVPYDEIFLTEKGSALRDRATDLPHCVSERVGLTAEESGTLYRLLYKLLDNIKEG